MLPSPGSLIVLTTDVMSAAAVPSEHLARRAPTSVGKRLEMRSTTIFGGSR
jgi:hypothetical protein